MHGTRRITRITHNTLLGLGAFFLVIYLLNAVQAFTQQQVSPPRVSNLTSSWVGNTFGGGDKWVQNAVEGISVAPDGTVYTTSHWDEAHHEHGVYKNGDVIGNEDRNVNSRSTMDHAGRRWTIESDNTVVQQGGSTRITGFKKATAVAVDNKGRLMVADDGPGEHIIKFYDVSGSPRLVWTFGTKGGIASSVPGEVLPTKFWGITGVGSDAVGNLYIGMSEHPLGLPGTDPFPAGTIIRSFKPDGTLRWEVNGLHFTDSTDFVPDSDGREIYGKEEYYVMDYSKPAGHQWRLKGWTVNKDKFPQDPRLRFGGSITGLTSPIIRTINQQRFMFLTGRFGTDLYMYKFNYATDGYTAIPFGEFKRKDGYAFSIEQNGTIWEATESNGIYRTRLKQIDGHGNLIYGQAEHFDMPAPFNRIEKIEYDGKHDVMYIGGFTPDSPGEGFAQVGTTVARYDNWTKSRTLRWKTKIPFNNNQSTPIAQRLLPQGMAQAGDYIFIVYLNKDDLSFTQDTPGMIRVYNAQNGKVVGRMYAGSELHNQSGWVDINYGVKALKRSNGEYLVLVEEDWKAKNILYQWCPSKNCFK